MKKILIVRLSAIGDTIHTLPLAYVLKKHFPDASIDWIAEDKASKFIINNPLINKVYEIPKKKWKKSNTLINIKEFFSIINSIRKERYDIVIDTQQLLKSGIITGLSGAKRKVMQNGAREFSFIFANEIIKSDKKLFDINYHVVNRNLDIAKYLGCSDLDFKFIIPDFEKEYSQNIKDVINNLDKNRKTIAIAPATTWVNKHWSVQGWIDIINTFKERANIIITASENDKALINQIVSGADNSEGIIDLTGKTSLSDLVYIYKNVDLLITPDSGSAHTAWASNCKSIITLFFATSKNRTAPFGENYYSISSDIECSPCMKKKCRLKHNKNACIEALNSEKVINIVNNVLQ